MKQAACIGKAPNKRTNPEVPDPWFPGKGESLNTGKIICFTCPVREACDQYRIRTKSRHGMWAGAIVSKDTEEE
jgi:hypothetical protein